jgi:hypothetical protein
MTGKIRITGNAPELRDILPAVTGYQTQTWSCWQSPESCVDYLESHHDRWTDPNRSCDMENAGGLSMAQAFETCRRGWPQGAERVARLRERINAARPQTPRLSRWDVAGAYPSVARHLAGNPLNMRRIDSSKARRRPVLTLVNHMGGSYLIDQNCFTNKCAVVAAIVDAIEAAGFSCHVIGLGMATKGEHLCGSAYQVKAPGETVDTGRLAFALGHVAFFRRIGFDLLASDTTNRPLTRSFGRSTDFVERVPDVFVLPSMNENGPLFCSEDLAESRGLQYFIGELVRQGCPAFPTESVSL